MKNTERSESQTDVRVWNDVLIPMRDGVNLAANLHMPNVQGKFPAVINYTPYHKDDMIFSGGSEEAIEFAERGYVYVFLDMRGTGGSEGAYPHPMRMQLWEDGYDAVEWLSRQPWCDGNLGMCGSSYGAYSAMNVASLNPPHLKAIIPIMGDVSWFTNNHPGGVLECLGSTVARTRMIGLNFMPPMYTDEEDRWMEIWNYHLQHNSEELFELYDHPTEDAFMREGAALFRLDEIRAATYVIGGFRDLFPKGQFPLYDGLKAPKKILMGPWKHERPNAAIPGPRIDHVSEMIRWFDHWLKGIDTGIMDEPPITIFVQGADGYWRNEEDWPIARRNETALYLHPEGALQTSPYQGEKESDTFDHNATVGTTRLMDQVGIPRSTVLDQRDDEALSLTYTTQPLPEDREITGVPIVKLFASTTADEGMFSARLNDVAPDGSSAEITDGCLNIAHRESLNYEKLLPVVPGEVYELTLRLCDTSYLVKAGHRLRLAIASSDFPYVWPSPKPAVNTVYHGQKGPSHMVVPFVPEQVPPLPKPTVREPAATQRLPSRYPTVENQKADWRIERDLLASTVTVFNGSESKYVISPRTTVVMALHGKAVASTIAPSDVSNTAELCCDIEGHELGDVNIRAFTVATCKGGHSTVNVTVNGLLAFSKTWSRP